MSEPLSKGFSEDAGMRDCAEARVPERDWAGRGREELSPLTLPVVGA